MNKNRFKLISIIISACFVAVLAVTASFAWISSAFNISQPSSDKGIGGGISSLSAYFDGGSGTDSDPYIIDRPIHWANLVELHNTMPDFYKGGNNVDKGYSFQVGKLINGEYKVYTDNKSTTTTDTLDCSGYAGNDAIIPIGSPQYPFLGSLNGNSLTISGFTVKSKDKFHDNHPLEDIGIFGYVGPNGNVHDVYFDSYTIDTTGSAIGENDAAATHVAHLEDLTNAKDVFIGTIAGHIHDTATFDNVYSNNCTLEGTASATSGANTNGQRNRHGYFGKVESSSGGGTGLGNSYKFTLNSAKVVNRLESAFSNVNDNPIAVRDTYFELNKKGEAAFDEYGNTINPYTNGVRLNNGAHNLLGDDREYSAGEYKGYNYTLSTTGYWPMSDDKKEYNYYLYYKDGNNQYQTPADGTVYPTLTTNPTDYDTLKRTANVNGSYIHYDSTLAGTKYQYYKVHTFKDTSTQSYGNVKLNVTIPNGSLTIKNNSDVTAALSVRDDAAAVNNIYGRFYIDGQPEKDANGNIIEYGSDYFNVSFRSDKHSSWIWRNNIKTAYYTISLKKELSINRKMVIGNHHVAFLVILKTGSYYLRYNTAYLSNCYVKESSSSPAQFSVSQGLFTVTDSSSAQTVDLSLTQTISSWDASSGTMTADNTPTFSLTDTDNTITPYVYPDTSSAAFLLYGTETQASGTADPKNLVNLTNTKTQFSQLTSTYKGNPNWIGHIESSKSIPDDAVPVYIADGIEGYNKNNIDVVGGGVRFSDTYLTLEAEEDGERTLMKTLTSSDIGQKFYAGKYCANSIIMYLNNVGEGENDDDMGYFHINYEWNLDITNTRQVVFRKGDNLGSTGTNNRYVTLANACATHTYERDIQGLSVRSYSTLKRDNVKKASFCALDANGKIIAVYDASGKQKYPTSGTVSAKSIDKYVLALGARATTLFDNLRISKIEFEYSAEGSGGGFGKVDYRSSPNTVNDTKFNCFFYIPQTDKFRLIVSQAFDGDTSVYTITVKYYCATDGTAILGFSYQVMDLSEEIWINGVDSSLSSIGSSIKSITSASFT